MSNEVRSTVEKTSIKDILSNPTKWEGKEVILEAEFVGWGSEDCDLMQSSLKTRSDVVLKEGDYCIFSDPILGLNPREKVKVRVKGIVEIYFNKPRLKDTQLLEKLV